MKIASIITLGFAFCALTACSEEPPASQGSSMSQGPSASLLETIEKGRKADWGGFYDGMAAKSQRQFDEMIKELRLRLQNTGDSAPEEALQALRNFEGKDLFVFIMEAEGSKFKNRLAEEQVRIKSEKIFGNSAMLSVVDSANKERAVAMIKENNSWKMFIDVEEEIFEKAKNNAAAQRGACLNNLRQINANSQQYMLENNTTAVPPFAAIANMFMSKKVPTCPAGGTYTQATAEDQLPTCSLGTSHNHSLTP